MNKEILIAREQRSKHILEESRSNKVIVIKANIAGENKNLYYSSLIIKTFLKEIKKRIEYNEVEHYSSLDGNYYLVTLSGNLKEIKRVLIDLEDNHLLGRLVDLDLYYEGKQISRRDLGNSFRKCLICSDDAIICMKTNKHSLAEVLNKSELLVHNYLSEIITTNLIEAITLEASLDPKFGLVTKTSKGSHSDMDFDLLMKSRDIIVPDLGRMFFFGINNNLDEAFKLSRKLGISTEERMFMVTNGVNTYKGLIFLLGIVLTTMGYLFKNKKLSLYESIKELGRNLVAELDSDLNTFGGYAYKEYGFLGIRGEVASGLVSLRDVTRDLNSFSDEELTLALIKLIGASEDTVLLRRSGSLGKYEFYKNLVVNIKEYNLEKIEEVTRICVENNISFGGSADLLATAIFIKLMEKDLVIKYG